MGWDRAQRIRELQARIGQAAVVQRVSPSPKKKEPVYPTATASTMMWFNTLTTPQAVFLAATIISLAAVVAVLLLLLVNPSTNPFVVQIPTLEATIPPNIMQLAEQGVSRNAEWTPHIQDFDGVEMVLVPAGCFMMGSEEGEDDEKPVHEVCFREPFWIDRFEVSNAQFEQFNGQAARSSNWTDGNLPRETITWFEARDFCELRGGRLLTEAEWEYAARGPDGLTYPWGNNYESTLVNDDNENGEDNFVNTAPVDTFVNGAYLGRGAANERQRVGVG